MKEQRALEASSINKMSKALTLLMRSGSPERACPGSHSNSGRARAGVGVWLSCPAVSAPERTPTFLPYVVGLEALLPAKCPGNQRMFSADLQNNLERNLLLVPLFDARRHGAGRI